MNIGREVIKMFMQMIHMLLSQKKVLKKNLRWNNMDFFNALVVTYKL